VSAHILHIYRYVRVQ